MAALGPASAGALAFRMLGALDARTSYSHHGGYYCTLDEVADFDEHGF